MTVLDDRAADLAAKNAELRRQFAEAQAQQDAVGEILQVINASPGDLAPVFDAILEKAHTLCGVTHGSLQLYENGKIWAVATRGLPEPFDQRVRQRRDAGRAGASLLAGKRFIQLIDETEIRGRPVASDALTISEAQRAAGLRVVLYVPLRRDNEFLGFIAAGRHEGRPFTDKQIALLQNFSQQAVIAMENARLIAETREALEQQTATAEVLQVINSSPGELAPVFDAILDKALRQCDAAFGIMTTYDGEQFHTAAHRGMPAPLEDALQAPRRPADRPTLRRLLNGELLIHVSDITEAASSHWSALAELGGARATVWVALRKDDRLLGTLAAYRQEARPFTDKQIALLENFAAQAVIAMENARLLTETREALEQQTATAEVLQVINASPGDLTPVFDAILEKAHTLCGADHGHLTIYDGDQFRAVAARNVPEAFSERLRQPFRPGHDFAERMLAGERLIHVTDMAALTQRPDDEIARGGVDIAGIRTLLFVPLRKDGRLLGYITAHREEVRPFTDGQIALLENFAAQAVIAMENARLLGELRQRTDEIAAINRDLEARVAAQVEELGRVGRLKRFLAPQLAEMIVSQGDDNILESHRREIVVVFCDLRGFTAFAETAEPEEVLDFLREYHAALGPLVARYEGTLDHFSGDGIMVFFNDPVPCPDPAERAVAMAVAMREAAGALIQSWRRRGRELGFGAGIAQGYATLGQIGFADRSDYTAIGTVCNLASRLCNEAKDGQILVSRRIAAALDGAVALEEIGDLTLKGLTQPVAAFNIRGEGACPIDRSPTSR